LALHDRAGGTIAQWMETYLAEGEDVTPTWALELHITATTSAVHSLEMDDIVEFDDADSQALDNIADRDRFSHDSEEVRLGQHIDHCIQQQASKAMKRHSRIPPRVPVDEYPRTDGVELGCYGEPASWSITLRLLRRLSVIKHTCSCLDCLCLAHVVAFVLNCKDVYTFNQSQ
jgi:hypothetical protein